MRLKRSPVDSGWQFGPAIPSRTSGFPSDPTLDARRASAWAIVYLVEKTGHISTPRETFSTWKACSGYIEDTMVRIPNLLRNTSTAPFFGPLLRRGASYAHSTCSLVQWPQLGCSLSQPSFRLLHAIHAALEFLFAGKVLLSLLSPLSLDRLDIFYRSTVVL